jgi:hypothetical protein
MNKTSKILILAATILAIGIIASLVRKRHQVSSFHEEKNTRQRDLMVSKKQLTTEANSPLIKLMKSYQTPIEFYGKVVDQHGDTIEGATVNVSLAKTVFGDSDEDSEFTIMSDSKGLFSVNNLRALALGISVTKEGYLNYYGGDTIKPVSSRSIDYGLIASKGQEYKNPKNPTLFTLHKLGLLEPIVYVEEKRWRLRVDGTPREIALDSKEALGRHQIRFKFTSNWNELPKNNEMYGKQFDWVFEAFIPGGGFLKNDSDYNLEAPEVGYSETLKLEYPASMPKETWKAFMYGRYFVKFADGTHGRIRFSVSGNSDDSPLSMTSWMNLKPGSRNVASPLRDTTIIPED